MLKPGDPVRYDEVRVGLRVMAGGPDWFRDTTFDFPFTIYEMLPGTMGTIVIVFKNGLYCEVEWDNGKSAKYRTGLSSRHDLRHVYEQELSPGKGFPTVDQWQEYKDNFLAAHGKSSSFSKPVYTGATLPAEDVSESTVEKKQETIEQIMDGLDQIQADIMLGKKHGNLIAWLLRLPRKIKKFLLSIPRIFIETLYLMSKVLWKR
jgi:hypothetical protein